MTPRTTSSRAIIYNENLAIVGTGQQTFPQHFPQASWVEHDLGELWHSVEVSIVNAIRAVVDPLFDVQKIVAIGITTAIIGFVKPHCSSKFPYRRDSFFVPTYFVPLIG